jgi:hypothetical protein
VAIACKHHWSDTTTVFLGLSSFVTNKFLQCSYWILSFENLSIITSIPQIYKRNTDLPARFTCIFLPQTMINHGYGRQASKVDISQPLKLWAHSLHVWGPMFAPLRGQTAVPLHVLLSFAYIHIHKFLSQLANVYTENQNLTGTQCVATFCVQSHGSVQQDRRRHSAMTTTGGTFTHSTTVTCLTIGGSFLPTKKFKETRLKSNFLYYWKQITKSERWWLHLSQAIDSFLRSCQSLS